MCRVIELTALALFIYLSQALHEDKILLILKIFTYFFFTWFFLSVKVHVLHGAGLLFSLNYQKE